MMVESDGTADATRRLNVKKQTLDDAYAVPANFLEIDVHNPKTTAQAGKKRYTEYEVNMRVSHSCPDTAHYQKIRCLLQLAALRVTIRGFRGARSFN